MPATLQRRSARPSSSLSPLHPVDPVGESSRSWEFSSNRGPLSRRSADETGEGDRRVACGVDASTIGRAAGRDGDREGEGEGRPPARLALGPDLAPMRGDDLAGDRQAQAGAVGLRAGDAVELLEEVRQVLRRDALAGVGDGESDGVARGLGGQPYRAAARGVGQGVADEVVEDVGDPVGVDRHGRQAVGRRPLQFDPGVAGPRLEPLDGGGDQVLRGRRPEVEPDARPARCGSGRAGR